MKHSKWCVNVTTKCKCATLQGLVVKHVVVFQARNEEKYLVRYFEPDCFKKKQKKTTTLLDLKYQGSQPKRGLLWIKDYALCLNYKRKRKKKCALLLSSCAAWHSRLLTCAEKQAIRNWFWSGDKLTEMENEGFTHCEINKNITAQMAKWWPGKKPTVKTKLSPRWWSSRLVQELCGKPGSDGVTSFNQMLVRSYITARVVLFSEWSGLKTPGMNLSVFMPAALSQTLLNKQLPSQAATANRSSVTLLRRTPSD